jgi:hypothetical protein
MKKFAFTVQVFGLMAMLPIFVILEMNHGTDRLSENNTQPIIKETAKTKIPLKAINSEAQQSILITN